MPNNFAKILADKMKFGPMVGGGKRKSIGGIDYNSKPSIVIEKKVDVAKLIEGQPFKRKKKRKPTRKAFMDQIILYLIALYLIYNLILRVIL